MPKPFVKRYTRYAEGKEFSLTHPSKNADGIQQRESNQTRQRKWIRISKLLWEGLGRRRTGETAEQLKELLFPVPSPAPTWQLTVIFHFNSRGSDTHFWSLVALHYT